MSRRHARRLPRAMTALVKAAALGAFNDPQDDQKDHGADEGVDDGGDDPAADDDAEPRQQPAGNHRADDADDNVADQTEAAALDHHAGKPAGDRADDKPYDNALRIHLSPGFSGDAGLRAHPALQPGNHKSRYRQRQSRETNCAPKYLLRCNINCGTVMAKLSQLIDAFTVRCFTVYDREPIHGRRTKEAVSGAAEGPLRHRRNSAARSRAGEHARLGDPQGAPRSAGDGDAAGGAADLADRG